MDETNKKERLLDKRTRARNIKEGLITEDDVQSYLKSLPDSEENASWVLVDMEDAELGEEEFEDEGDLQASGTAAGLENVASPEGPSETTPNEASPFSTPDSNDPSSGNL